MAITLSINDPSYQEGEVLSVGGVAVPNGGSVELSEEQEAIFCEANANTVQGFFENSPTVEVSGSSEYDYTPPPEVEVEETEEVQEKSTNPLADALASEEGGET